LKANIVSFLGGSGASDLARANPISPLAPVLESFGIGIVFDLVLRKVRNGPYPSRKSRRRRFRFLEESPLSVAWSNIFEQYEHKSIRELANFPLREEGYFRRAREQIAILERAVSTLPVIPPK
jgi:hypothetical protein